VQRYKDIDVWSSTPVLTSDSFALLQKVMTQAGELTKDSPYDKVVNNAYAQKAVTEAK